MPMQAAGDFGTETDGSPSGEYCVYCYKGGTFTAACTMEEMIRHCAQFHEQFRDENGKSYTFEESVTLMREYFPHSSAGKKTELRSTAITFGTGKTEWALRP